MRPARETDFVLEYASHAPLALALERSLECRLLSRFVFQRPVLDVGCGDGLFAKVLFGPAMVDEGVDPDPAELARARRRNAYLHLHQAEGQALPLPDASTATVISNSTLEHIVELDAVLREVRRVLRPGGTLFATVPTDRFDRYSSVSRLLEALGLFGAAASFRGFYDRFWRHYHFYPPEGWAIRMKAAGLRVVEVVEYDSPSRCMLHDLLVPLALPAFVVKKTLGRFFLFPGLRRTTVRLLRGTLPRDRVDPLPAGTGGLVLLRAVNDSESL